jgi:hypothetical protein
LQQAASGVCWKSAENESSENDLTTTREEGAVFVLDKIRV